MACKNFTEIMFLTISMFWQWQNKHFFFSRQILNPRATFLKLHPNIVAADFVLLFPCWFGMSYWQLKSIHGDGVMRTRISEQPDTDHYFRADDYEEQPGQFLLWHCKVCEGILPTAKWTAVGWLSTVCIILQDFPLKVSKIWSQRTLSVKPFPEL